jgi:sialic acid synthase SpsE
MLIAEIGNNHFGDMTKAKALIRAASDSGADLVKGQAFSSIDLYGGSMPNEFYDDCEFRDDELLELIDYARTVGTELFFSIFSPGFEWLFCHQDFYKVAATQTRSNKCKQWLKKRDTLFTFVSIPEGIEPPELKRSIPMHVTPYLTTEPNLKRIETLGKHYRRDCGYSDHTVGIRACLAAINTYNCRIIEKHFTLQKDLVWGGKTFRDTVHGATPFELQRIAKELKK